MDISRVKYNLGKPVRLTLPRHCIDDEYVLSGCTIRRNENGDFFYQAELMDRNKNSVIYAALEDISEIKI